MNLMNILVGKVFVLKDILSEFDGVATHLKMP